MLYRALVVAFALASIAIVTQQSVVGLELFPGLLRGHLERDNHECPNEESAVSELYEIVSRPGVVVHDCLSLVVGRFE